MGYSSCQPAHGFHLLGLEELLFTLAQGLFRLLAAADVIEDAADIGKIPGSIADDLASFLNPQDSAVPRLDPVLPVIGFVAF